MTLRRIARRDVHADAPSVRSNARRRAIFHARAYLTELGVNTAQVVSTTRGDLDASGTDEPSWRLDRRVDLELAN